MIDAQPTEAKAHFLRWRGGEPAAGERLTATLDAELHGLARLLLRREGPGHTLQPTELVNEACLRLLGGDLEADDRRHFLALAARTMRQVLVDHARRQQAGKRIPKDEQITLDTGLLATPPMIDVLSLADALTRLGQVLPRAGELVELRYFGGLTCAEAARLLETSLSSVERAWRAARAWLRRALATEAGP